LPAIVSYLDISILNYFANARNSFRVLKKRGIMGKSQETQQLAVGMSRKCGFGSFHPLYTILCYGQICFSTSSVSNSNLRIKKLLKATGTIVQNSIANYLLIKEFYELSYDFLNRIV
jgi:hypothetical protein